MVLLHLCQVLDNLPHDKLRLVRGEGRLIELLEAHVYAVQYDSNMLAI